MILGICQQPRHQATATRPSLWDPTFPGEPVKNALARQQQARLLCATCPLLGACERMLSDAERRGVLVGGVVAGRYSDIPQQHGKEGDLYQERCRACGKQMLPQAEPPIQARGRRSKKHPLRHMGEGLCDKCYPVCSRWAHARGGAA